MKTLFCLFLWLLLLELDLCCQTVTRTPAFIGASKVTAAAGGGGSPPSSPLLTETFEATEYDNSWTENLAAGTLNGDYTGVVLAGAQSMRIVQAVAGDSYIYSGNIASLGDPAYAYFRFRPVSVGYSQDIFSFWDSSFAVVCRVEISDPEEDTTSVVKIYCGSTVTTATDVMTDGTTYHVWIAFSDAANTASVEFNTTGTRSDDGTDYKQTTGGTTTTSAAKAVIGGDASDLANEMIYDTLWVDDVAIPSQ